MTLKSVVKSGLLATVSAITGRHAVLLPPEAESEDAILSLRSPYRVEGDVVSVELQEPGKGELTCELLGYRGHFPRESLWKGHDRYERPCRLELSLKNGTVSLDGRPLGTVPVPIKTRRFCWNLELTNGVRTKTRLTGHYCARTGTNGAYYSGDNYVDYETEARGDVPRVLELLRKHHVESPVLEIGCATGVLLEALTTEGLETYGVDYSAWAIERARKRVPIDRAFQCDVEKEPLPGAVAARAPFQGLLLWAVLEHFHEPYEVLRTLVAHLPSGGKVVINTTNARSLSHLLFGRHWEGYFDTTHHGVDAVSVDSLRSELPELGLSIRELTTHLSWDSNADPTHATLREWWASDARFRRLLSENDRGDLITCVAVKA